MPADPAPADAELLRLLDALTDAAVTYGQVRGTNNFPVLHALDAARWALDAYLDRCYVRRDRLYDDGPWDTLPGEDQC